MFVGFFLILFFKDVYIEIESQEGVIVLEFFLFQLKNMVIMKKVKVVFFDFEYLYRFKVKYVVEFKVFIFYDIFFVKILFNLS